MFPDGLKKLSCNKSLTGYVSRWVEKTVKQQIADQICFPMGLKNLSSNKSLTGKPLAIHVRPKAEWRVYQLIAERQPSETYSRPNND
jgi:hypothetical protein